MKKIALSVLLSVLSAAAVAGSDHPGNGFSDLYTVVNGNVLGGRVLSGQINYQPLNNTQFLLTEQTGVLTGGVAEVIVGQNTSHLCMLTIQDVDFNYPVLVSQKCIGGVSVSSFDAHYNDTTIMLSNS